MTELLQIQDFIQKIAEGITLATEIDTQVIDCYCNRIAGTVSQSLPPIGGVVRNILKTGLPQICTSPGLAPACQYCDRKENCNEKGFIHYPIFYDDSVVGVMGIICFTQEQAKKIDDSKYRLFSFIEQMCSIIQLKLKEYEIYSREAEMLEEALLQNQILNQAMSQISNGYIFVNKDGTIRNYNDKALQILHTTEKKIHSQTVYELIPDPAFLNLFNQKRNAVYERIYICKKEYGIFVTFFYNENELLGCSVNFKTIDSFCTRMEISDHLSGGNTVSLRDFLGESKEMLAVKKLAQKAAVQPVNVLITGESGTGKEFLARAIHGSSNRSKNPFIAIDCQNFSTETMDEELFGSPDIPDTTPDSHTPGALELASSGTIFLNRIELLPISLQFKLLSCIKNHNFNRKGSNRKVSVDVRIIVSTSASLKQLSHTNEFLEELYYCLSGIPITLPPLRTRKNDIMLYACHILDKHNKYFTSKSLRFDKKINMYFSQYAWPGNIHEMENAIQYMLSIHNNKSLILTADELPVNIRENVNTMGIPQRMQTDMNASSGMPLRSIENQILLDLINERGETVAEKKQIAEKLGISLSTLYRRLSELPYRS